MSKKIFGGILHEGEVLRVVGPQGLQGEKGEESDKGLRQIILKEDLPFSDQLSETDTIYVIRYDYNLDGSEVSIPENCTLKFEGGSLLNGTIIGQDTHIVNDSGCILNTIQVSGTFKNDCVYSYWVNNNTDKLTLQTAANLCRGEHPTKLFIEYGEYTLECDAIVYNYTQGGIIIPGNTDVDFQNATIKAAPTSSSRYCLICIYEDNISIKNGFLIGDVGTHTGSGGEWGFGVNISGAKNVILDNIYCTLFWGDGIMITRKLVNGNTVLPENILLRNCTSYDNRRQGLSVICGKKLRLYNSKFIKTGQTAMTNPGAGIDFEQDDSLTEIIDDVVIDGCEISGSRGLVIWDKLTISDVRTTNILVKDTVISGTSQVMVKEGANLHYINCSFLTGYVQYYDGDVTFDDCTFKGQWFITAESSHLPRECTVNFNYCTFNLSIFYTVNYVFSSCKSNGLKTINFIGCTFDVNSTRSTMFQYSSSRYYLVNEDSSYLDNIKMRLQNCTFQCSSDIKEFSSFNWYIWASEAILGCTINDCRRITLYRRAITESSPKYSFKVKENIVRFVCRQATAPYFNFAGDVEPGGASPTFPSGSTAQILRDFVITDNIFFFNINEAPLWTNPGGTNPMNMTFTRNLSIGKIITEDTLSEYFNILGDLVQTHANTTSVTNGSGKNNFIVSSSLSYNSTGIPWQRAIESTNKMAAFYNGTNWVDCMGKKLGIHHGENDARPNFLTMDDIGYQFFDTDLGYVVTWNGSHWVDSTGVIPEPVRYTELATITSSVWTGETVTEGATALLIQSGNYKFVKCVNNSITDYTFADGSIIKYQGYYYTTESNKYLIPYYGVDSVNVEWVSGGYKLVDGELTTITDKDFKRTSIEVHVGERYVFLMYGGASTTEIIKEVDGVYTSFADKSSVAGLYLNVEIDEDCTLYLSNYSKKCVIPTVAIVRQ